MAIKYNTDGTKEVINVSGKIDGTYFPKSWYAVQLIKDNTSYVFNVWAKLHNCTLNKDMADKLGGPVYGPVYSLHPEMVSARIKKVKTNDLAQFEQGRGMIAKILGIKKGCNRPRYEDVDATVYCKGTQVPPTPKEDKEPNIQHAPEATNKVEVKSAPVQQNDNVNHPNHYTGHPSGIECIEITRHYDFCIGNAIKYLWRAGLKSEQGITDNDKQIQDLQKAIWYINDKIKQLKS